MKLRNKKTGKVYEVIEIVTINNRYYFRFKDDYGNWKKEFNSLIELNEEWEDYEEPKDYYFIRSDSLTIGYSPISNTRSCRNRKEIGNYFETEEKAEKAVEKLKAWKLLKDECNIKFDGIIRDDKAMLKGVNLIYDRHTVTFDRMRECMDALHLLFGGEE